MSRLRRALAAIAVCVVAPFASAQEVKVHAYADARLVDAANDPSFVNGGPGRLRYGDGDTRARFGAAALVVTAQVTPALFALADVQLQQTDHASPQLMEAFLRYRPLSLSAWRASLKGGLYFIPISLENDGIGWTSPWTVTPSAINSWVGEELRGLGAEAREEWRGDNGTLGLGGGLFRHGDPAGNILATRGWSLSDLVYGVGGRLREPSEEDGGRQAYAPLQSVGGRTGWYADTRWTNAAGLDLRLLRYDNRADPHAHELYAGGDKLFAWRTRFWSVGAKFATGPVTWIAQGMDGDTDVQPRQNIVRTHFQSGFLLAGWNRGAWRPTLRVERFRTWPSGERGRAVTAALNWRPSDWLRLTAEWLHVAATRDARADVGLSPHERGNQLQLLARVMY
ncbi:MAG TPA: hypothetical protein VM621_17135 [Luteibacter sp.]|uniref:hypothetical protein n=1 Tax=Luteibacter sp. TaxID=1886636 RepID=UPI002C2CBAEE|nr:hypothetical protein [Luteibacter sp.]HVI56768.1 hypothetical protein [Luteibacter sp.]